MRQNTFVPAVYMAMTHCVDNISCANIPIIQSNQNRRVVLHALNEMIHEFFSLII